MDKELIVIMCFVGFLFLFFTPPILYFKLGWFKFWFHDVMGWHQPDFNKEYRIDEVNEHSVCKYCGQHIMMDSQGNWF